MAAGERKYAFLSYSRRDQVFAARLAQDLRASNIDLWIDLLDIPPGANWDREIEHALEGAHSVLCVVSDASANSDHVLNELSYALSVKKEVIPLLIAGDDVPLTIHRLQRVDFKADYAKGLAALLRRLTPTGRGRTGEIEVWRAEQASLAPAAISAELACTGCGAARLGGARFCPDCGQGHAQERASLAGGAASATPPRTEPPAAARVNVGAAAAFREEPAPARARATPHRTSAPNIGAAPQAMLVQSPALGLVVAGATEHSPALALCLSLLIPGLGQLYVKQTNKGVLLFVAAFLGGPLSGGALWLLIGAWSAVDAYRVAKGAIPSAARAG